MNTLTKILFLIALLSGLNSCFTTNLPYNNPNKVSENVYEFQNPRYSYTPNYTGISIFTASILGITAYSITNPWYYMEDKKSPTFSAIVGISGVVITAALIKVLFYSNTVREGREQKWLDQFKYKLSFIEANYGQVLSSSTFSGTKSVTREVTSIRARFIPSKDPVVAEGEVYDFDKMFYENGYK